MKNVIKRIIQYSGIFIMVLILLLGLLLTTMKIPKAAIEDNLKESAKDFEKRHMVHIIQKNREYTYLHLYSESALLNIIYCVDTNDVLKSAMLDRYYESTVPDMNKDFVKVVTNNEEPNTQYLRYWHGSMIILRPLLTVLSFQQIIILNYIIINILFIALFVLLLKKSKKLALLFVISMLIIAFPIVAISPFYSWTFYIMLIASIIAILIEKKGDSALYKLFFITGMVTCFFDFLTTEIITLFVPMLLVLFLRKEREEKFDFKKAFKFVFISSLLWGISYVAMFAAKWLLASIVLQTNAMEFVTDNLKLRINGADAGIPLKQMYLEVIPLNFYTLYPICNIKRTAKRIKLLIGFALICLLLIDWKNIKKKKFSLLMLLIAIIPYLRYIALVNHSLRHYFFTYREQIITIIAIGMILIDCFNYKLWFKEIRMKRRKDNKDG